ncbi:hypothetical protein A3D81_01655 [Candidatus Curtissbacteria bacterium RIFCSPHIGHO2_02_FULL_40_17]|uniref:Thioredoxin domain-containing protein n=4 Tax=Candidatus Curtissiibacteriota TaxID=1752717 RepID=A0A1F5GH17_9BACT|nr:MAG: hypothetical protein A2693_03415 [Candidatus Curtissbacteria bacterium RIFCSPHIGHO2_01_FULL_40_12]OGD91163.1 MAG: hypothetical protein A3D81_01655 [Candidatus Curtissbacteria bacterium RIFCSPHIGHO2_02_FULL_40_17]OGE05467.1 MAG: hypothetical protein A3F45_03750 [Candidatus Curtissbacteria bacterium RIFCSPHIGHO2_12_FULL_41_17]OGE07131.1 MAG: hypothetical protein A3I53_02950 [Candidatus Curtissbacteria bacterium RIFCSPLOWO2_02_FULL_40_13b]
MNTNTKFFIGIGLATILLVVAGVFLLNRSTGQKSEVEGVADQAVLSANTRHAIGDSNASVKIVEFADFQCPACKAAHPIIKKVTAENADKVYFVYRHYPLPSHKNGKVASQAAEAAGLQGKFWEMHNLLYEKQSEWSESNKAKEVFESYAANLGLDTQKFKDDMASAIGTVNQDYADGNKVGVSSTPTFFINGQKYSGVIPEGKLTELINTTQ